MIKEEQLLCIAEDFNKWLEDMAEKYKWNKTEALDKIRAKIEALEYLDIEDGSGGHDEYIEKYEVLKIIDKYKAESEE